MNAKQEQWMSARGTRNPVLEAFRDFFDGGDPWGSTLSAHFDIAECLYRHGVEVPAEWEYRPSPMIEVGEFPEDDDASLFYSEIEVLLVQGHVTNLIHAGNVLARYAAQLKLAGYDY
jgi:hypothetical protein